MPEVLIEYYLIIRMTVTVNKSRPRLRLRLDLKMKLSRHFSPTDCRKAFRWALGITQHFTTVK